MMSSFGGGEGLHLKNKSSKTNAGGFFTGQEDVIHLTGRGGEGGKGGEVTWVVLVCTGFDCCYESAGLHPTRDGAIPNCLFSLSNSR